jgi:hypothetical protein
VVPWRNIRQLRQDVAIWPGIQIMAGDRVQQSHQMLAEES